MICARPNIKIFCLNFFSGIPTITLFGEKFLSEVGFEPTNPDVPVVRNPVLAFRKNPKELEDETSLISPTLWAHEVF